MKTNSYKNLQVDIGFKFEAYSKISVYSELVGNAKCAERHRHPRAQMLYCDEGIMKVNCGKQSWLVNSLQGVWIPGNIEHQVFFPAIASVNSIFIDPDMAENLPVNSFTFDATPFFKNLVLKIASLKSSELDMPKNRRLLMVLLDELTVIQPSTHFLPLSDDSRVMAILDEVRQNLSGNLSVTYFANKFGMSSRTLTRLFYKEIGMSLNEWTIQMKLNEAIKRLENNNMIKEIAIDLGYENAGSFIDIFKKRFHETPGNYYTKSK